MNLTQGEHIILNILNGRPNLGKTALMKIVYLLQQIKQLELGYDFDIYTYGPYASEVTIDLDNLISDGFVLSAIHNHGNYFGYELNISETGKEKMQKLRDDDEKSLQEILSFAADKSARDLELYSTIVFINHLYQKNKMACGSKKVVDNVHEIKPHFDAPIISEAYRKLVEIGYIQSVVKNDISVESTGSA
jgi:uncharacterized protein YwgA